MGKNPEINHGEYRSFTNDFALSKNSPAAAPDVIDGGSVFPPGATRVLGSLRVFGCGTGYFHRYVVFGHQFMVNIRAQINRPVPIVFPVPADLRCRRRSLR